MVVGSRQEIDVILDMIIETLPKYRSFSLNNFEKIEQVSKLTKDEKFAIQVVGNVLPFKVNPYVLDNLIDWDNRENDSIYHLTFPQKEMLTEEHFDKMASALIKDVGRNEIKRIANEIRMELNPHPAGQASANVPSVGDSKLDGVQHKYRETLLFFPSNGQTCHAYCTFCFRWPQFVGLNDLKFASRETELMVEYLKSHPEITDVLFTGGDPMIMGAKHLEKYVLPILDVPSIKTIRFGTKVLGYWPHRFLTDPDADDVLRLFEKVVESGRTLAFMAHFNHVAELLPEAQKMAVKRVLATGAQIRTQSPLLRHINDDSQTWTDMWKEQVNQGMIPYYMFLTRDTGAQHYFAVPLVESHEIFKGAYEHVSGICRTVRGPSMSAGPGKVQVLGPVEVRGEKALALRFIQGRDPSWVHRPFFAKYDPKAVWLDELKPAFGESKFFFE